MKNVIIISIILLMMASNASAQPSKTMPMVEYPLPIGTDILPDGPHYPYIPETATDIIQLGLTYNDMQSFGASGDRIAFCDDGSVYCCWTNLSGWPYPPSNNGAWYALIDPSGNISNSGPIDSSGNTSYPKLDIMSDNRGAFAYGLSGEVDPPQIKVAYEWNPPGIGIFDYFVVPNELFPQTSDSSGICYWPNITVDRNDNVHLVATEYADRRLMRLGYARSDNRGLSRTTFTLVDTVMVPGAILDASPVSDRVVLAYAKTQDTTTQWYNDIVYYVSDDGETWDWRYGEVNITNYGTDDDSLWAYTDLDVIIDYNDYIHLIWTAQWVVPEGIYYRTQLFHYSEETEEITEICHHPDSLWISISGAWNRPICKMSLGLDGPYNGLTAAWTQFDTTDVSAGGYGNGDIYISFSYDGGSDWDSPLNITESHTPGCFPGDCNSEHFVSLADSNDYYLHLTYIQDKDAGSVFMEEGAATENPVIYEEYTWWAADIDNDVKKPAHIALNQNFPNPFNSSTNISFSLKDNGPVRLEIFDVTGSLVETLIDEYMPIGNYDINWNAEDCASGTYIYKLTSGGNTSVQKAVLIK